MPASARSGESRPSAAIASAALICSPFARVRDGAAGFRRQPLHRRRRHQLQIRLPRHRLHTARRGYAGSRRYGPAPRRRLPRRRNAARRARPAGRACRRSPGFRGSAGRGAPDRPTPPAPSASARWHRPGPRPGRRNWGPARASRRGIGHHGPQTALGQGQAQRQAHHAAASNHHIRLLQNSASIALKKQAKAAFCIFYRQITLPVFESRKAGFWSKTVRSQCLSRSPGSWPAS